MVKGIVGRLLRKVMTIQGHCEAGQCVFSIKRPCGGFERLRLRWPRLLR